MLVIGATGSTGQLVVAEAIARGHTVRALARDRARAPNCSPPTPSLSSVVSPGPRPCPRR
ncbi:NAD(P)H-binding protein [Streptomyces sp. NPDC059896]|uniref:NAD(P)H-binding protein n=1 Tax=Streptomyces sp. NPDC059896 TaxID=3346993 RepID=UPI00365C53D5